MPSPMNDLNYAVQYQRALSQAFPYALYYGALYNTPNNNRYRWVNAKTIEIPHIRTSGRVDADRDSVTFAQRNYDNDWETKTLTNQRKWSTLVHPMDIDQTNMTTTIANITKVMNEENKFPEMDAYTISKIWTDWCAQGMVPNTDAITVSTVLGIFDALMLEMDNERVPVQGRILYVTNEVKYILKEADKMTRNIDVNNNNNVINRVVNRLDEVQVIGVPAPLMKTKYVFTNGWAVAPTAQQINMMLIHPTAVITPVSYTFSKLDAPAAGSEGKYVYYEESFEDVFILNHKKHAIQFNVTPGATTATTATTN